MTATSSRDMTVLVLLMVAGIASTATHYTHNFIEIDHYPQTDLISNEVIQVGIVVSWPLLTAFGLAGCWLYSLRRLAASHACLSVYSLLGLVTLGHFLWGSPDIPPVWYATIFTDALTGLAVLAFVAWSVQARRRQFQT